MTPAERYAAASALAATPQGREWLRYHAHHAHTEEQRDAAAAMLEEAECKTPSPAAPNP